MTIAFDREDTQTRMARPATMGDVHSLQLSVKELTDAENRRAGSANVWRVLGGLAASAALAIATWALTLGQSAAVDHDRLAAVKIDVEQHELQIDALGRDIATLQREAAARDATQTSLARAVQDLTAEVRELRRDLSERRQR